MAGIFRLSRQRSDIRRRIEARRAEIKSHRRRLRFEVRNYLGTPKSLIHAFLAGFLIDQGRPMFNGRSPSWFKNVLPALAREIHIEFVNRVGEDHEQT